jgi:uncharacterized protein
MTVTEMINEQRPAKPFPRIWPAIGWVVLFIVLQLVAGVVAVSAAMIPDLIAKGAAADAATMQPDLAAIALPMIISLVIAEIFLLFLLWLYLRKGERVAAIQLDKWSDLSLGKTILLAVGLIGLGFAFNYAYGAYVVPDVVVQEELRKFFAAIPGTVPNTILLFVTIAVIAPLVEELLFRGLLQKSLSHKLPIWAAIAISALVFGAMHGDFYAMPPLVIMGVVFGVIYHLTGSLRVNIALHMINNAAALLLS